MDKQEIKEVYYTIDAAPDLAHTADMMKSTDYKERFKAEYYQLLIRIVKLENMVKNWDHLSFTPTLGKGVYEAQISSMYTYLSILTIRAAAEEVEVVGVEEWRQMFEGNDK